MGKYGEGVNYAKAQDPSSANIIDPGLFTGKVRVMQDYATISASSNLSSAYILVGGKLPTGSQVVQIILSSDCAIKASGTKSTVTIGDEGDPNRYMEAVILHAASTPNTVHVGPNVVGGMYYTVTGVTDNYIRIDNTVANAVLSSGTVKITVFYIVE